jgi:transmembrane sensor
MKPTMDAEVLDRYLAGESTPAEAEGVRRWLEESPGRAEAFQALRTAGTSFHAWDAASAWNRLQPRLQAAEAPTPVHPRIAAARRRGAGRAGLPLTRIAAGVAVLAASAALLWTALDGNRTLELATAPGEQASLRLADGSEVVLGPDSRLSYPKRFRGDARTVHLEGEAYFEVEHRPDRAFVVHARDAVTQVLGTGFGVRAYPQDAAVRVVVASGRVRVRSAAGADDGGVVLEAGELARLSPAGAAEVTRGVEPSHHLGWREGRLAFDDVPLRVVLVEVGRAFDLRFEVADPELHEERVSASFRTDSVEEVLGALSIAVGARYERDGRSVVLSRREAGR